MTKPDPDLDYPPPIQPERMTITPELNGEADYQEQAESGPKDEWQPSQPGVCAETSAKADPKPERQPDPPIVTQAADGTQPEYRTSNQRVNKLPHPPPSSPPSGRTRQANYLVEIESSRCRKANLKLN